LRERGGLAAIGPRHGMHSGDSLGAEHLVRGFAVAVVGGVVAAACPRQIKGQQCRLGCPSRGAPTEPLIFERDKAQVLSVALGETPRQRIFGKGIINGVVYDFLRIEKFGVSSTKTSHKILIPL